MEKPEEVSTVQKKYPSLLTSLLQTCMNILRDQKAVDGLQEMIDKCDGKGKPLPEHHTVHKVEKGKKRTSWGMRLSVGECQYCSKNVATPGLPTLLLSTW